MGQKEGEREEISKSRKVGGRDKKGEGKDGGR